MNNGAETRFPGRPRIRFGRRRLTATMATLVLAAGLFGSASSTSPGSISPGPATIVFMTDFGTDNDAVPICKGVIYNIDASVRIVDLTHQVRPYSILNGARFLFGASPYYPAGTIFLTVIDPGVGSARKAIVVKSRRGQYFVLPDNGLMTLVETRDGIEGAREITNPAWMIGKGISSTFHGRDIFSPAAAHLARGEDWTQVGPEVKSLVHLDIPAARLDAQGLHGEILALDDPYGSLISNIDVEVFQKLGYSLGDKVHVIVGKREFVVPYVKTFSEVPTGEPLLYIDSRGHLGLALNQDNFSRVYKINPPVVIWIPRKKVGIRP